MTMTTVTFEEERSWMADALTRLVNFSTQKLKHINYPQFADAVEEFLCADFFQYQAILIYNYNFDDTEWRLLSWNCMSCYRWRVLSWLSRMETAVLRSH